MNWYWNGGSKVYHLARADWLQSGRAAFGRSIALHAITVRAGNVSGVRACIMCTKAFWSN